MMKSPKIRFKGFDGDWEQRKLGDVAQEFKSGNSLKADEIDITGDYPVYGGNGLRGYTSTYNHDGEYALIGRQGALCGNMNYSAGKAYFTEHAVVVKADENNDTRFLYYMLDTMNLGQYSDQSAQPGLAVNKLVKLENSFPKKEEQQQIGAYFRSLDHLITLHQKKSEQLTILKKYMMQKMFPQNGSDKPEIRFDGFTDDWEQRKLSDVVDVRSGRDYKHLEEGDIPVYGTGGYMLSVSQALSDDEDAIGIGRKGTIDNPYILRAPFWTVDTLFYAVPREKHDLNFVYGIFQNINWKAKDESTGVPSLSKATINAVSTMTPDYEEQRLIGEYFSNLDHLITLHQQKCDELRNAKKFMLQNMFI